MFKGKKIYILKALFYNSTNLYNWGLVQIDVFIAFFRAEFLPAETYENQEMESLAFE